MWKYFTIAVFFLVTGLLHAANPGDEVIVVYNSRLPASKDVAEHYAHMRHVPASQVFGFDLTTNEAMSRAEFHDSLEQPLAKQLEKKKLWRIGSKFIAATNNLPAKILWTVQQSKIRYAVLCYGVPVRIENDPSLEEKIPEDLKPELRRNGAAVDSELALLPCNQEKYPRISWLKNPYFTSTNAAVFHPTNGILIVTRLDGPSASIARSLVDKAMEAEKTGLCGRGYFDLRNVGTNSPYHVGDDWILGAGKICQYYGGYDTTFDTNAGTFPADFPMSQIAVYCGWYEDNASGPFAQKDVEFLPGAFAYHLHSYSAATIRSTTEHWVGPLLAKGATATMGAVDEPFIIGTPDVSVFCARWIVQGFTYGEAAYASLAVLSWQTTVIGDPLYRPFGKSLQSQLDEQQKTHAKSLDWTYVRAVNVNLFHGKSLAEMSFFLQSLPLTMQSAVLSEKLADLYNAEGKPASTVEMYENALKLPTSPLQRVRIRLEMANRLAELNRTKEASADLKKLLDEDPDYPGKATVEQKLQDLTAKLSAKESPSAGKTTP